MLKIPFTKEMNVYAHQNAKRHGEKKKKKKKPFGAGFFSLHFALNNNCCLLLAIPKSNNYSIYMERKPQLQE